MDSSALSRIEQSFQAIAPRGPELVDRFYALLFARHPSVRQLFPQDMSAQKQKLLASLKLVIQNIRAPEKLREPLLQMGARHANYGAQPAHYPAVRDTLIEVLAELAGPAWTPQHQQDWTDALNLVATVMLEGQRQAAQVGSPE